MQEQNAGAVVGTTNKTEPMKLKQGFWQTAEAAQPVQQQTPPENKASDTFTLPDNFYKTPGQKTVNEVSPEKRETLGVLVSDDQWRTIREAISTSDKPEEDLQRYASAITFSREYGVPIETAMQNLEEFTQYQLGESYTPTQSTGQALVNSFKVGAAVMDRTKLAMDFRQADLNGEDTSAIDAQMKQYDQQIDSLRDYTPRNWVVSALKSFGENSSYLFDIAGQSLAVSGGTYLALNALAQASGVALAGTGGIDAPLVAGIAIPTAAVILTAGAAAGTYKRSMELEQAQLYYELRQNGVEPEIANYASSASGVITGIMESVFDILGGKLITDTLGKSAANSLASRLTAKLAISGKLGGFVTGVTGYTLNAAGEFPQEYVEAIATYMASETAYELSNIIPPERSTPILQDAFQQGMSGFAVGMVSGLFGGSVNIVGNMQDAVALKQKASSFDSEVAFIKSQESAMPENVEPAVWDEAMSTVWKKEHDGKNVSTAIQSEESAVNELDAKEGKTPSGIVRRLNTGELFTKDSDVVTTDTTGAEHHQMLVGDPVSGKRYGTVDYSIAGNSLEISDVLVRSGYEAIRKEAVLSLAKQYPGYDITWDAKGENLQGIKNEIIEANPRGKEAGVQYFDGVTNVDERIALDKTIKDSFTNLSASQVSAGSTLLQLAAKAKGMDTTAFMESLSKDGKLFESVTSEQLNNPKAKGAVRFDQDMKALVYVAEKADFSTFVHETFHILRRTMGQTEQLQNAFTEAAKTPTLVQYINDHRPIFSDGMFASMSAEEIAQSLSTFTDTWTRVQEEAAAKLYESYRSDGTVSNKNLEGIFKRIAQWMNQIYQGLKHTVAINPEIAKVFDSFVTENASVTDSETVSGTEQVAQETLFQEAPPIDSKEFKAWFGDSKVVDDNGNPLVVYHGTDKEFSIFDANAKSKTGHPSAKLGFYFTSNKDVAEGFSKDNTSAIFNFAKTDANIVKPFFLNIKNPKVISRIEFTNVIGVVSTPTEEYGFMRSPAGWESYKNELVNLGYDGVIISKDTKYSVAEEWKHDNYVAFSPTQIKSINNKGSWDSANPNILFQEAQRQYDAVVSEYTGTEGWMKAPNGKATNLNERQWVMVRTPAFLSWFGDWINNPSSVAQALDLNGEPEVFYHGSYTDLITVFEQQASLGYYGEHSRGGFSFTNKKDGAKSFAVPEKVRMRSIQNYLTAMEDALLEEGINDSRSLVEGETLNEKSQKFYELIKNSEDVGYFGEEQSLPDFEYVYWDEESDSFKNGRRQWSHTIPKLIEKDFPSLAKKLRAASKNVKLRGVTTPKVYEVFLKIPEGTNSKNLTRGTLYEVGAYFDVRKEQTKAFVVNMPNDEKVVYIGESAMIKSVDNDGTFLDNPNILFQETDTSTPEFKKWFGKGSFVDSKGNPLTVYHGTDARFDTFSNTGERLPSLGYGYYFTPDISKAQQYGKIVMPVYLNSKKVLDWKSLTKEDRAQVVGRLESRVPPTEMAGYDKEVRKSFQDTEEGRKAGTDFFDQKKLDTESYSHDSAKAMVDMSLDGKDIDVIWREPGLENASDQDLLALAQKYDMQIADNLGYDAARFGNEIVVFSPTQVKSVYNRGTWDAAEPNIMFQEEPNGNDNEHLRYLYPKVRGGWTKAKIIKALKSVGTRKLTTWGISKRIAQFDDAKDFYDHIYYHGTGGYIDGSIKPSITSSDKKAEQIGGGGYGEKYWGISISKNKRTAEAFSGQSRGVTVYPVILDKYAKVKEIPGVQDASDIEDHIVDLWTEGVDAVWIGGGEQEMLILNPMAAHGYREGNYYAVFGGYKSENMTLEKAQVIYDQAKVNAITKMPRKGEPSPDILLFQEDGNPKFETDFPKRPDIDMFDYMDDLEGYVKIMDDWEDTLKAWVDKAPDLMQFGNEDLVHVVHKNVIPEEGPWRGTSFINRKGEWTPLGHRAYATKYEAVKEEMDLKDYRPDILFQEDGSMAVLHNLNIENVIDIEALGGMPMPSIAVTRKDIKFDQFGSSTLIADPSVAKGAMDEGRLFDRDVWSPTVPRAEWKVNQKEIFKFDMKLKAVAKEAGAWIGTSETFRSSDIKNGLNSIVDSYKNNLAAQLTFLKDSDIAYELKYKKPDAPSGFPIEVIEANKDYFDSNSFELETQDEIRAYLTPIIKDFYAKQFSGVNSKFKRNMSKTIEDITSRNTSFSTLDQVFWFAKKYDPNKTEFDEYKTKDDIKPIIKDHDADFTNWLKTNLKSAYSDPSIKIKGKKYSYDVRSVMDWMRSQNDTGVQSGMTYGPKLAGSFAAKVFRNRGDIAGTEQAMVSSEEASTYYEENIQPLVDELNTGIADYYNGSDSWEAFDSAYKAIGKYLKKGLKNKSLKAMETALRSTGFSGVPSSLIETAADLAENLKNQPQDYYEAKPNRIIRLNEFKVAVIPDTASMQSQQILARNGITVVKYDSSQNREDVVQSVLDDKTLLFQEQDQAANHEQILQDAKGFDTWEGLKYYYEGLYAYDIWGEPLEESYQDDEWYQAIFNEANGVVTPETPQAQDQKTTKIISETEQQKDDYFTEKMSTDEGISKFIGQMGWALTTKDYEHGSPGSQKEVDYATMIYDMRVSLPDDVHPTVLANAYRMSGGKSLTPKMIKGLRTLMTGEPIRYYRDIYADLMEDPDLKPQVIDERLPTIDEPGYEELDNLNITERINLAKDLQEPQLRKKFLSGKETMQGDAEMFIDINDRKIAKLNKQITVAEKEIEDTNDQLSEAERTLVMLYRSQSQAQQILDKELKAIKAKNDNMETVPQADLKSTFTLESKLRQLHEQIIKQRASQKVQATVKRHEALDALKAQLKEKQAAKDEARKVREYKLKLARKVMVKPSDAIDWEYAQKMYKLQATMDPKFRRDLSLEGVDQERLTLEEAQDFMAEVGDDEIREALGDNIYKRIMDQRKPLNEWTVEEMEELAETMANLRDTGRQVLAAKNEQKRIVAESYQREIIKTLMQTGKYIPRPIYGTAEEQKQRNSARGKYQAFRYVALPMRVKAMMLDNNTEGSAYDLLITQKRTNQGVEWASTEKRQKPIFDLMKEVGLTETDLYKTVSVSLGDVQQKWTYSSLMYAWLSQFEESNRLAVSYGTLVTVDDKIQLKHDNELIKALGDARYTQLLNHAKHYLVDTDESGKYMALVKAIQKDFNGQVDRINEVAIREYNQPMRAVDEYLPIHRKEITGTDLKQNVADDWFNVNAGGMATSVSKGFTKTRINISPDHQGNTDMDLMNVWDRSVRQQEHMIAFAEYGRKLNRVFKNLGSRETQNFINQTYGTAMMDDINDYIDEVMNPQSFERKKGAERMVKTMRGNLGAAYLAWKMSTLVLQAITSPMPFLSDVNPANLIQGYVDMGLHYHSVWEFVQSKSQMMKNRSPNIIIDQILQESKTFTRNKFSRFNAKQQVIGTMGLTLVDRFAVAGGWLAAYRQQLAKLGSEGMTSDQADKQAALYADDVVLRTQPTGDKTELSPLFKTGGEFAKIITQFQTALNVIWANTTYDIPNMIKDSKNKSLPKAVRIKQFERAVGQVVGYVLAGAILGAVQEGHEPDDEPKDKVANYVYWSLTQFLDSSPLIGQGVNEIVKSAVTGEKPQFYGSDIFPAISNILDASVDISQGTRYAMEGEQEKAKANYLKSLKNMAEGFGYGFGAPVSGTKQLIKSTKEGPGALLGR